MWGYPLYTSRWQYVFSSSPVRMECCNKHQRPDTPWDEPTKHSPEFYRYLKGTIFDEDPWNRISDEALCMSSPSLLLDKLCKADNTDEDDNCSVVEGDVGGQPGRSDDTGRRISASLVHEVRSAFLRFTPSRPLR